MTDTRKELSKILIKWHMQTNQAAINEMVTLIHQSNRDLLDDLEIWSVKNGITHKQSFIALRDKIAELRKKNENT